MELSFPAARGILAMCEYHYRLGVLHACYAGDAELVRAIADRDDAYSTFQYLDEPVVDPIRKREFHSHVDQLIATCRRNYADSLANYLRLEKSEVWKKEVCAIIDYHYRKGLLAGLRLRDKKKAKSFYDSFSRGSSHPHLFDKQKEDTMQYFDNIKHRINKLHFARLECKKTSSLNRLSSRLGQLIIEEKNRRENARRPPVLRVRR